jgi:hypothetical protein
LEKIDDLSDFGPDESTSLRPVDKGFNFTKWVVELNETTLALELQEIKLKSANKVHNEWFGDDKSRVYLAKSNRATKYC